MARRRKTRKGRAATRPLSSLWLAVLLLVVLGGGAWYYATQRGPAGGPPANEVKKRAAKAAPAEPLTPAEAPDRFEFYDTLPQAEVPIAEDGKAADISLPPVATPGTYVVQAGAFPAFAEADKVKARLALLGIVAEIQSAQTEDGRNFHRVRIGPIDDLNQLNRLRARLRQNRIDFMVIPVVE